MKELKTSILIVGAGLTGLLTAFTMSSLGKNIILVDRSHFLSDKKHTNDLRTTAISEGSKIFFESINFWSNIKKFTEPIKFINVIDRQKQRRINFFNSTKGDFLGYIIKNRILKKTLINLLKRKKNVNLIDSQNLYRLDYLDNFIYAKFDDIYIKASLLIAADGKKSSVKNLIKTPIYSKVYNHEASVINIQHSKNHNNIAHEIFLNSGPLAILPMPKIINKFFASSVIWSNPNEYSNYLKIINKALFKKVLEEKIFSYVGEITKIIDLQFFPLSAHINSKFYDKNIVYIGDAAHSIHPIAGQGWNLGVRDIKNLQTSIKKNIRLGLEIGNSIILKEYHDKSFYDSYNLYQITDKLNSIFINDDFFINQIRRTGFKIIQNNQLLKKNITKFAMGL